MAFDIKFYFIFFKISSYSSIYVIKTKSANPDLMADDGENMKVEEISKIISEHCPVNSDAFQDVWLHLLETDPDDMHQLHQSIRKAKNKKITEYFHKKKEISQFDEHGENILDRYKVPIEFEHNNESDTTVARDFYKQIAIYFLKEFLLEKQKNGELRKELGDKKLENSHKWRELRQDQLNKKYEMFVEKKKRWEFRKEVINKKLEISRKWQELRKKQSNKKYEMFQKKYELRKRSLDLEMNKLGEKRHRTRSFENTLYNRLKKIEKSLKLQQTIILGMVAKAMPEIRR
jgi:hypothetical protein